MKPIKVIHIVSVDKENYYLNNLNDYTNPKEIDFSFITLASEECDFVSDIKKRGKTIYALNTLSRKEYPKAFRNIWSILKKENPDIVHTHLFDPTMLGITAAKWQKRKTIFTRHHSDALYQISSSLKRDFYLKSEKHINNKADHIIAPSQMVSDILTEKESVPKEKVSIVPYGQTTERFDLITKDKIEKVQTELGTNENLALVCVSRLFDRKGHKYLFEAFSNLVKDGLDATLYLVGTGDHKTALENLATDLNIIDRIKFLGWRNDALAIIAAADIIVHPSLEDALSSAVIETLMLEKPIVATDISGVRDSLDNGKYGKIVPPADVSSFQKALKETIENIELANEKAKQGRKYLLEYMDAKRVAVEHQDIYRHLLDSN